MTLGACTQVDTDGLDPTDSGPRFPELGASTAGTPPAASAPSPSADGRPAAAQGLRLRFSPVVGAPAERIAPMGQLLADSAARRGIAMAPADGTGATHVVNGYFSAFSDSGKTTVVHVWDVLAPDGKRLHRIQGQAVVAKAAPDAWSVVDPDTMGRIAEAFMTDFAAFAGNPAVAAKP